MMSSIFPEGFVERMREVLGEEVEVFLRALENPSDGLRVNTLRLAPEAFRQMSPFELEPLPFPSEGFRVLAGDRPGKHPYHAAGLYYLQDPGAMALGGFLDPGPGERVLDLAAAPGGKATHVAALMRNEGLLVANDVSRARARELAGNLERCGVRNAIVLSDSAERLAGHFGAYFDRVLLDAPCSGESMFHKSAAARGDWSSEAIAGCSRRQRDLIATAAELVRPGGVLVYSTCTFAPEENEEVAAEFVSAHPQFEAAELDAPPGAERVGSGSYRLWPHRSPGAGHFMAAFRRTAAGVASQPPLCRGRTPREAMEHFERFRRDSLPRLEVDTGRVELLGRELHELPAHAPSVRGLRVIRAGLWLGSLERDRFEPAHALALAVTPWLLTGAARLTLDDERVERYLKGHPIEGEGSPGWVPVTVDGFALGWGKRVGSTVKNHYPKGLRWQG